MYNTTAASYLTYILCLNSTMPNYSDRIIEAAIQSGYIERESLGIVNPSILMWDMLFRVGQIFCSEDVYNEMDKVNVEGDYFSIPDECDILKGIEGLLLLEENFMRRVPEEFQDDPIRYISLGWSTGGEMNTFKEEDLHTFINYIPLAVQRFSYRSYEANINNDDNEEEDDVENESDAESDAESYAESDAESGAENDDQSEDEEENYISDASTEIVSDNDYDSSSDRESEYDSMPELEAASVHDNYIECPESSPWIYYPNHPNNNSIQV